MDIASIQKKALNQVSLSREECKYILTFPQEDILVLLQAAYTVRKKFVGNTVEVQILMNAKSGYCGEDCQYCSQSRISEASIEKYPLKITKELMEKAKQAKESGANRYCMALSSIRHSDHTIEALAKSINEIKTTINISLCCSIGFLTTEQAKKLKQAGLDRVNHNINTGKYFYPHIATSHTYEERIENLKRCKAQGLELCSGGIVGMGESHNDIIDMMEALIPIEPESIPINFLIPVKGTPMATHTETLTPIYCLQVLCLARFMHPDKEIRAAGGRERNLRSLQSLALYPANSIFVSGYLTTGGQSAEEGITMVRDMGFTVHTSYEG